MKSVYVICAFLVIGCSQTSFDLDEDPRRIQIHGFELLSYPYFDDSSYITQDTFDGLDIGFRVVRKVGQYPCATFYTNTIHNFNNQLNRSFVIDQYSAYGSMFCSTNDESDYVIFTDEHSLYNFVAIEVDSGIYPLSINSFPLNIDDFPDLPQDSVIVTSDEYTVKLNVTYWKY